MFTVLGNAQGSDWGTIATALLPNGSETTRVCVCVCVCVCARTRVGRYVQCGNGRAHVLWTCNMNIL
jgi:hypothetical protein